MRIEVVRKHRFVPRSYDPVFNLISLLHRKQHFFNHQAEAEYVSCGCVIIIYVIFVALIGCNVKFSQVQALINWFKISPQLARAGNKKASRLLSSLSPFSHLTFHLVTSGQTRSRSTLCHRFQLTAAGLPAWCHGERHHVSGNIGPRPQSKKVNKELLSVNWEV